MVKFEYGQRLVCSLSSKGPSKLTTWLKGSNNKGKLKKKKYILQT